MTLVFFSELPKELLQPNGLPHEIFVRLFGIETIEIDNETREVLYCLLGAPASSIDIQPLMLCKNDIFKLKEPNNNWAAGTNCHLSIREHPCRNLVPRCGGKNIWTIQS
jgi:hypothetical protein